MSLCILLYTHLNTFSCILFRTSAASQKQQRTLFVAAFGEVFTDFSSFSSHGRANFLSLTPGRRTVTGPLILTEKPLIQLQENMFFFSPPSSYKRLISAEGLLFVDTQRHRLATVRHNSREGQALSLFSLLFLFYYYYWCTHILMYYMQRLLMLILFRELLLHGWSFTSVVR